jgi:hypothetical protein
MHASKTAAIITIELSSVEELPSAQQRIHVLSVARISIHGVDVNNDVEERHENVICNFQTRKKLSFPITHHCANNNGNDSNNDTPPIILNRLIEALRGGNHKIILREWKQGARWWNLNMNNHANTSSTSSTGTTNDNGSNTLSMARAEVAGYRLAKWAIHKSQQHCDKKRRKTTRLYIPDVLYFSHDGNDNLDTDGAPWALLSYHGDCQKGRNSDEHDKGTNIDINILLNSSLNWDLLNATSAVVKTTQSFASLEESNHFIECKHYPSSMTKFRHEFGFDEPHPRHGRVPIDDCLEYAQMILREVVLPIQFSFFEWSLSSSSSLLSSSDGSTAEMLRIHLCALGVDRQTAKPYHYHDMVPLYRLALQRLSTAQQNSVRVDDERMDVLLQMMKECVDTLESHEWDVHDGRHPPFLPPVLCHMDLQPQNLTFFHDRKCDENHQYGNVHVSKHCSIASVMDFEEAAYADPRFEVLLICRKVLANIDQAQELWKSYSTHVKLRTMWDVGPIEPWLRLETVHSLLTLMLQANDLLGCGRHPWETKPDLWGKIDRERRRLVAMGWSFCSI